MKRTMRWRSLVLVLGGAATGVLALGGCKGASSNVTLPNVETEAHLIDQAASQVRDAQRLELDNKDKQAIAKYQEAITTYRELPVAWNNLGALLLKLGENLQAEAALKTASELSPTDPRPVYNLGTMWEKLGYYDDALKWYDEAIKRDNYYLPALRRRVLIDQLRDRPDAQTFEDIKRALLLEKDPWWIDRLKRADLRLKQSHGSDKSPSLSAPASPPPTPPAAGMPVPESMTR